MFKSKLSKILVFTYIMCICSIINVYALEARISFSDPSVNAGSDFDVTANITAISGGTLGQADVMLKYDSSKLQFLGGDKAQGDAGTIKLGSQEIGKEQWTYNLKFKALATGQTKIEVGTWEIYDTDLKLAELSKKGSSTINIAAGQSASDDAKLQTLNISPGTLTPAFSSDIYSYTANVGIDVSNITVNAETKDKDAKYNVSGNENLVEGDNNVAINVTAADGKTTNTYNIIVTKANVEAEETENTTNITELNTDVEEVTIDGQKYQIANMFDVSIMPKGFTQTYLNYDGKNFMACENKDTGIVLAYLIAQDGSGDFYSYDSQNNIWSRYVLLVVGERTLSIIQKPDNVAVPAGLVENKIKISDKEVTGWLEKSEETPQSCIVYAMNSNGDKGFYRYDLTEKTIQRYFDDGVDKLQSQNKKLHDELLIYRIAIILLIIAVLLLILALIVRKNNRKEQSYSMNKDKTYKDSDNLEIREEEFNKDLEEELAKSVVNIEEDIENNDVISNKEITNVEVTDKKTEASFDDDFEIIEL